MDKSLNLFTDRHALKHILLNLISNAIKYNVENGKIFVRCEKDGSQVILSVRDTGIGIPSEKIANVFEPFDRLGKGENIAGTGIGLTICKKLADLLDATISVASTVNEGSTFTIRFATST